LRRFSSKRFVWRLRNESASTTSTTVAEAGSPFGTFAVARHLVASKWWSCANADKSPVL
jgi:hypothetical protein